MRKSKTFILASFSAILIFSVTTPKIAAATKNVLYYPENQSSVGIIPRYSFIQSFEIYFTSGTQNIPYTIDVDGASTLKSISGTATLYKKNSAGSYEQKASKYHSIAGPDYTADFSFPSYGSGSYKITFSGTAYSTSGGQESINVSDTGSY